MRTQEFTGKTTQEAIDAGLAELGVTIADVHVDVLQEGAKGLFGLFGSKPARVRITVLEEEKEDDHGLSDLLGSFSLNDSAARRKNKPEPKPEKKPEPRPEPKPEKKPEPKAEKKPEPKPEPKPEKKPEPRPERAPRPPRPPRPPRSEKPEKPAPAPAEEEQERREYAPMIPAEPFTPTEPPVLHDEGTPAGRAQKFLMDVTALMGVKVDVYVDDSVPDHLSVRMIGDTLGVLIGRRGETLDALQYLTSLQVNKGREGYIRVTLDTENYRAKREDSLRRLAQRMANRAQKTGRKVVLEPMNPYERRVLHTALQGSDVVTTHSEGEEPNRRVVITLKNPAERPAQEPKAQSAESAQPGEEGEKPKRSRSRRRGRRGSKRGQGEAQGAVQPAETGEENAAETAAVEAPAAPETPADETPVVEPKDAETIDVLGEEN